MTRLRLVKVDSKHVTCNLTAVCLFHCLRISQFVIEVNRSRLFGKPEGLGLTLGGFSYLFCTSYTTMGFQASCCYHSLFFHHFMSLAFCTQISRTNFNNIIYCTSY